MRNGYGPTEVTIGCTMLPRMSANDKASNIGPQFDNPFFGEVGSVQVALSNERSRDAEFAYTAA
jgi:hypothetical protein